MIQMEIISEKLHSQLQYEVNEFAREAFIKEVQFIQIVKEEGFLTAFIMYEPRGDK